MQRAAIVALCVICAQMASSFEDGSFNFELMRFVPNPSKRSISVAYSPGERTDQVVLKLRESSDPWEVGIQVGLEYLGQVGDLPDTFLFRVPQDRVQLDDQWLLVHESVQLVERQYKLKPQKTTGYSNEPLWDDQWHLQNTGQNGGTSGADAKLVPVWTRNNFGQNSQVAIVDDGFETLHPDLSQNYVAADSYDFVDNDPDPNPSLPTDGHGVSTAGVVGARDEGTCGVGAAYRARLAGIRLISAPIQYSTIASAETFSNQNNWIYSNSWTFPACSNSSYCDLVTLPTVIQSAFSSGATSGRGGKGSIFVYAAGNARTSGSNINYEAMQRSIYVIVVSAITNYDSVAYYSEPGAGVHVAAPSNGGSLNIYTSDRTGDLGFSPGPCTPDFGGTSSSCPLVSGIVALMLTANPDLTWRDVQYILAKTAGKVNPNDPGWQTNGAGFNVSHDFGFGIVDADAAVSMAETYTSYLTCVSQYQTPASLVNLPIPDNTPSGITSTIVVAGVTAPSSIEHTLIGVTINHPNRGQLRIILTSPSGTQSFLAAPRSDPHANYAWVFKSSFNWGESPNGRWSLTVSDEVSGITGTISQWQISFSGPCSPSPVSLRVTRTSLVSSAPSTSAPTTNAATTSVPTTRMATTSAPTTKLPTTSLPTTNAATTSQPTTGAVTSLAQTSAETSAPTTVANSTQSNSTSNPSPTKITTPETSQGTTTSDQFVVPTKGDILSEVSSARYGLLGSSLTSFGFIVIYVAIGFAIISLAIALIMFFRKKKPVEEVLPWNI